jgi:hypothetical protein
VAPLIADHFRHEFGRGADEDKSERAFGRPRSVKHPDGRDRSLVSAERVGCPNHTGAAALAGTS